MAILTYPLNGILYDAEDAEIYNCTRTSGVFASDGHFTASVTGSREVSIGPGLAWMQNEEFHGKAIYNPETVALQIAEADAYQPRIDRIVLRFDKLMNQTTMEVIQGTPASSPVAPDIERDSYIYDLGIYTVYVKASTISISLSDVTSSMLDDSVCGIMADAVTNIPTQQLYDSWYSWFEGLQVDTETLENQFNIWFEQMREDAETYMDETKSSFEVWMDGTKVDFDEWFDTVQDTLDSDTAGKLTNLVNDAQDTADEALEQLATGMVRGFMTDEAEGGEYALLADDSDDSHAITLMRPICNCEEDASKDLISDEFQENFTYSEGDYCIYDNTLYVFTADKSAGAWDWSCVKATNVGTELTNANAELASQIKEITEVTTGTGTINSEFLTTDNLEARWVKYGRVCTISLCMRTIAATTESTSLLMTGFPNAQYRTTFFIKASPETRSVAASISTSGQITLYYGGYLTSGYDYRGSVAYITADTSTTASPQSIPDDGDDDDTVIAPGPEIIGPDDDEPDDDGDGTVVGPGPEEVD